MNLSIISTENALRERGLYPLIEKIAQKHHVRVREVLSCKKVSFIVRARDEIYFVLREKLGSNTSVAVALNTDPSTVLYGVRRYKKRMNIG